MYLFLCWLCKLSHSIDIFSYYICSQPNYFWFVIAQAKQVVYFDVSKYFEWNQLFDLPVQILNILWSTWLCFSNVNIFSIRLSFQPRDLEHWKIWFWVSIWYLYLARVDLWNCCIVLHFYLLVSCTLHFFEKWVHDVWIFWGYTVKVPIHSFHCLLCPFISHLYMV